PQVIDESTLRKRVVEMVAFEMMLSRIRSEASQSISAKVTVIALEFQTKFMLNWTKLLNDILRKSMQQFIAAAFGPGNHSYEAMSDAQLIAKSMQVFKLAFQLAQNEKVHQNDV